MPYWASERKVKVLSGLPRITACKINKKDRMEIPCAALRKKKNKKKISIRMSIFFLFSHWPYSASLNFPIFFYNILCYCSLFMILIVPPVDKGTRTDWKDCKAELLHLYLLLIISAPGRWPNCQNKRKLMRFVAVKLAQGLSVRYITHTSLQYT